MYTFPAYEYKGFKYQPEEDVEPEENVKIFHFVLTPEGKQIQFDWSPYSIPTEEQFQVWVALGCPDRIEHRYGSAPLTERDLASLAKQFFRIGFGY